MMLAGITACIFLALLFLALFIEETRQAQPSRVLRRFAFFLRDAALQGMSAPALERRQNLSHLPLLNYLLIRIRQLEPLRIWIQQAGVSLSLGAIMLLSLFSGLALWMTAWAVKIPFLAQLVILSVGASMPWVWLAWRHAVRKKEFSRLFPDIVGRLSSSLRAGYSLQMAMDAVLENQNTVASKEFQWVRDQLEVGVSFEAALEQMLGRIDTPDLRLFIASVKVQRESGGNLAELLDNLEASIRERTALRHELAAATGQAKLSGIILSLLPIFVAVFIYFVNRDYILFFFRDPAGKSLLGVCLTGQILGVWLIRKIVAVDC